jgi:hypothetical protein
VLVSFLKTFLSLILCKDFSLSRWILTNRQFFTFLKMSTK